MTTTQGYENFVLESRLTDLLNSKINVRNFITVDTSLVATPGMKKKINTYTYTGKVEELTKGNKNGTRGYVTFTPKDYDVKVVQQVFDYNDEDFMQDPTVVDMGVQGLSTLMVNYLNDKFFEELEKTSNEHQMTGQDISYDEIVDAIAKMELEDESQLFLIIGIKDKATLRKDPDFKAARSGEIIYNGQIGSIAGIPVVVSKAITEDKAYLATKEAVTLFIKKESEIEQDRDKEKRINTIIARKVYVMALTNEVKAVKISKGGGFLSLNEDSKKEKKSK